MDLVCGLAEWPSLSTGFISHVDGIKTRQTMTKALILMKAPAGSDTVRAARSMYRGTRGAKATHATEIGGGMYNKEVCM